MRRAFLALLVLAVPLFAVPAQASAPDPGSRATAPGLDTMERRELRLELADLDGAQRSRAAAALARPFANRQRNFQRVRVHWTAGETTTAYAERVGAIANKVLRTYRQAGYRAPMSDGARGGNKLLDIYLQDLGSQGLYGYCDTDKRIPARGPYNAWAYCAFDNDYVEFPSHTPLENLQVTAAHELFHAVQFAYDYLEDAWFMESTATWAEDEVFDDVNDNVQYLSSSPLADAGKSMDHFESDGLWQYGGWIFFRFLTERDPRSQGGMPTLVRDMWARADGDANGPDDYSIEAVDRILTQRGSSLQLEWTDFAAASRNPDASYDEATANNYPKAGLADTVLLSNAEHTSGPITESVDHLAAATVRFLRGADIDADFLELELDLPAIARGSGAVATIYRTGGQPETVPLALNNNGNADITVEFGPDVKHVEVTMSNAGINYDCWHGTAWSCQGRPLDDNLLMTVEATAAN